MERKFHSSLRTGSGHTFLKVQGVIDEDNRLADLGSQIQGDILVLDVADVERINSCGVRDWVNWLNKIGATGMRVIMTRCSPAIIAQVNMVTNFSGDAVIHSFFAPYYNPETDETKNVLLYTTEVAKTNPPRAPQVKCDETGYPMEFDDFEESYFAFIPSAAQAAAALDARSTELVRHFTPELSGVAPEEEARDTVPTPSVPAGFESKPSIHEQLTPKSAAPVVSSHVSRPPSSSGIPRLSSSGVVRSNDVAAHSSSSSLPPPRNSGFISSPQDAAAAMSGVGNEPAWNNTTPDTGGKQVFIIAGLGVGLLAVFAVLLWIAFT